MGISEELGIHKQAIADIKIAIQEKGQSVSAIDTVLSLAEKIDKIVGTKYSYSTYVLKDIVEGKIEYLYDTEIKYVRPYCFTGCNNLKLAYFTHLRKICRHSFEGCYLFNTLVINNTDNIVVRLDSPTAFNGTPFAKDLGNIYVPDKLYNQYLEDETWQPYKTQIKQLSTFEDSV